MGWFGRGEQEYARQRGQEIDRIVTRAQEASRDANRTAKRVTDPESALLDAELDMLAGEWRQRAYDQRG